MFARLLVVMFGLALWGCSNESADPKIPAGFEYSETCLEVAGWVYAPWPGTLTIDGPYPWHAEVEITSPGYAETPAMRWPAIPAGRKVNIVLTLVQGEEKLVIAEDTVSGPSGLPKCA